jgi:alginate O-acetyltransferase complex protein AlgI
MLFNSLHFLLFFTCVTLVYFGLPLRGRWWLLLLASCYFYTAFIPAYLLILIGVILIDYAAARLIESATGARRRSLLILSLIANVGILAFFKYYDFAWINLNALLGLAGGSLPIPSLKQLLPGVVLPIGLSFHTFQSMSYTIEVYRGNQRAERNLVVYALYVLFYPQLVAGPIERPQNILWQFHRFMPYDWERVKSGLLLMAWGAFKKVVIADRLALAVDPAYGDVAHASGPTLVVATMLYSFQIYCDFSGYSDIAIGAARVMGFSLMQNFRGPYLAASITDFWRRWHISLSTWFRDYVYIPLGGSRGGRWQTYRNTLAVFLLSGLWHGADWKFVVWGGLHGGYLIAEQVWTRQITGRLRPDTVVTQRSGFWNGGRVLLTFGLAALAWVFFRARSVSDGWLIWQKMGQSLFHPAQYQNVKIAFNPAEGLLVVGLIGLLLVKDRWVSDDVRLANGPFWALFTGLLVVGYMLGVFSSNQFIYFQF